jgi:hypothetical protein
MCIDFSVSCKSIVNNYFQCIAQFNNQGKSLCVYYISSQYTCIYRVVLFTFPYFHFTMIRSQCPVCWRMRFDRSYFCPHVLGDKITLPFFFKTTSKYLSYPSAIIFSLIIR